MVVFSGPGFCNAFHRQFWNENQFTFFFWWSWFILIFPLSNGCCEHAWWCWRPLCSAVLTGHEHRATAELVPYVNVWFCLRIVNCLIQFHFLIDRWNFIHAFIEIMSVKWFFFFVAYLFVFFHISKEC